MIDVWAACAADARPGAIGGRLRRVVESQQQIATTELVDTLAEQALLEELVDASKPPQRPGTAALHYLLSTPFRYPPLAHGSRFGARHEPSLLYGAARLATALAECAYYRLVFWHGMSAPPPSGRLLTQHTAFSVRYRCRHGVRLQRAPFDRFEALLRDPADYAATQRLGAALRAAGVDGFEYRSARDRDGGIGVALFEPAALASRNPLDPEPLLCETRAEVVRFRALADAVAHEFALGEFLAGGRLPQPAP